MTRRAVLPLALGWVAGVLLVGALSAGAATAFAPLISFSDPRVGSAGLGAFVAHGLLCDRKSRHRIVLVAGVALELLRWVVLARHGVTADVLAFSVGYGLACAALLDLVIAREWRTAGLVGLVPLGMVGAAFGLSAAVRLVTPKTYDGVLLGLDATLRLPASAWAAALLAAAPGILALALVAYALLPGAIAAGIALDDRLSREGANVGVGADLLLAYAVSGIIAAFLYTLCPATGPAYAFAGMFPARLPGPLSVPLGLSSLASSAPRNAMPSLHLAWAIILARSTMGARRLLQIGTFALAAFTLLATLGSGEHYLVDLIVAVPFLVALEAATARPSVSWPRRRAALIVGVSLYVAWMLVVRLAPWTIPLFAAAPWLEWLLVGVTVGASARFALPPLASGLNRPDAR